MPKNPRLVWVTLMQTLLKNKIYNLSKGLTD